MATNATFSEVLEISVLTDKFASQMAEVERIYQASLNRMPSLGDVAGASLSEAANQINAAVKQMQTGVTDVVGNLGETVTDLSTQVSASMEKMASAVETVGKQAASAGDEGEAGLGRARVGWGRFAGAVNGDIPGLIANVAKMTLIFRLVSLAIEAVAKVVMAPFEAIKEGFTYLERLQERASQIKTALLQSVQFSPDWATNLRLAGEEADKLAKKVDDLAVKLRVKPEVIQTGFESFMEFGGGNLVKSADDALNVSGYVTAALQSQNPNIQTRKIATEIQQLVQGAIQPSDKLAAALGVNNDQLKEMVAHAKEYHDLFDEILAHSPGLADRLGEANSRQASLLATIDLYKQRFEGLFAEPLFERFTKILQDILGWLDKNDAKVQSIAAAFGGVVDSLGEMAEDFVKDNWDDFASTFKEIASFAISTAQEVASIANGLDYVTKIGKSVADHPLSFTDQDRQNDKDYDERQARINKAASDAQGYLLGTKKPHTYDDDLADYKKQVDDSVKYEILTQTQAAEYIAKKKAELDKQYGKTSTPYKNLHGIGGKADYKSGNTELTTETQQFKAEVEQMKLYYQELRDAAESSLSARTINHQQAAAAIAKSYDDEIAAMQKQIAAYTAKEQHSGADPKKIQADRAKMQQDLMQLELQADKAKQAAQNQANEEQLAIQHGHDQTALELARNSGQAQVSLLQEQHQQGLITEQEFLDRKFAIEKQEYQREYDALLAEAERYAAGTKEREAAYDRLAILQQKQAEAEQQYASQSAGAVEKDIELQGRLQVESGKAYNAQLEAMTQWANSHTLNTSKIRANNLALLESQRAVLQMELALAQAELYRAQAAGKTPETVGPLQNRVTDLNTQLQRNAGDIINTSGAGRGGFQRSSEQAAANQLIQQAQQAAKAAWDAYSYALQHPAQYTTNQITALGAAAQNAAANLGDLQDQAKDIQPSKKDTLLHEVLPQIIGGQAGKTWGVATDDWSKATDAAGKLKAGFEGLTAIVQGAAGAFNTVLSVLNQYEQGRKQGGVLGGVGSLLSSGPVSSIAQSVTSMIPVVGPIISSLIPAIGSIFSALGGLFTSEARKLAEQINQEVDAINNTYSVGKSNLTQTIQQLEAERTKAISELSGKKGGKSELDKILAEIDKELDQLDEQAQQTRITFEDNVNIMKLGGTELQSWATTWENINKQVEQYLQAGGSAATAQQYLNQQLQLQLTQENDKLNSGYQQAIQDNIQLIDLKQQQVDLSRQEASAEFNLLNQGSIEKRGSVAISIGQQLQNMRYEYQKQTEDLNYQVQLTQEKVDAEKKVFDLATTKGALEAQYANTVLYSLNEQLAVYKQIQEIIKNTQGLNFNQSRWNYGNIPGFGNTPILGSPNTYGGPSTIINITVNGAGGGDLGNQIANQLRQLRNYF